MKKIQRFFDLLIVVLVVILVVICLISSYEMHIISLPFERGDGMAIPGIDQIPTFTDSPFSSGFKSQLVQNLSGPGVEPTQDIVTKLSAASDVNEDVVGWIECAGLGIDYPVLYSTSNHTYLRTNIQGEYDIAGAIYLDARCESSSVTMHLIHGHNMQDGSFFSNVPSLMKLQSLDLAPLIRYTNPAGTKTYKFISVFSMNALTEYLTFDPWASLDNLIDLKKQFVAKSLVDVGEVPSGVEMLLLNTCWYGESGVEHNLHCIAVAVRIK